jgi:phosphohistidine phosphatase
METDSLRELFLIRHAKTDWDGNFLEGKRPLSTKGKKQASYLAEILKSKKIQADAVFISNDIRANQTFKRLKITNDLMTETKALNRVSKEKLLHFLGNISNHFTKVFIIGHDPELQELISYLKDDSNCQDCDTSLFPSGALAHFVLPNNWANLKQGSGKLVQIIKPRKH